MSEAKKSEVNRILHRMNCIDQRLNLYGEWNSGSAQVLFFVFKKCDKTKRSTCKSDEDIKKWLETRYLVVAYNKYTFI